MLGAKKAPCMSPDVKQREQIPFRMEQVSSLLFPKAKTFASLTKPIPEAGKSGKLQTSIRSAL
jgi:hypothetical protein